jgi:hypothetical protein
VKEKNRWRCGDLRYLPHVYIMVMSFGTSFPFGFMKNHCFTAVGVKKCILNTLQRRYVFGMVSNITMNMKIDGNAGPIFGPFGCLWQPALPWMILIFI